MALDALRGAAVGLMIAWHAADGWLADEHRRGVGFRAMEIAGGLGAPFFLLAAGAAVGLGVRRGRTLSAALARGLELLLLGHLLGLAQWAIDHAAIAHAESIPALALGLASIASGLVALRRRPRLWGPLGIALGAAHLAALGAADARIVLRFDVLSCIALSCIACALLAHPLARRAGSLRPSLTLASAALLLTLVSGWELPGFERAAALAWLAGGPEQRALAPFPLVPWAGYAMLGCAAALAPSRRPTRALALSALGLAALSFEGGFAFTRELLDLLPAARPLARLAFHSALAASLTCALARASSRLGAGLAIVGRASLAIYALHLFVTYGTLARPFRRALDPLACAALGFALALLCTAGAWLLARKRDPRRAPPMPLGASSTARA